MTASQVIEKNVLIKTLLGLQQPVATFPIKTLTLLAGTTDQYKVFWVHVPAGIELPYITVAHLSGGRYEGTKTSQGYTNSIWRVVFHTADIHMAEAGANAIGLLKDACPDVSSVSGVTTVTTIQEVAPIFDRYVVQNVPQFMVGGLYRIQLCLGDN